ncbi:DUF4864 domain-containing protein [Aestuariivirga litoralis]|uniref:DUF4864 domain-containing protein n=1 Tax=Aestuariivirga litoralis TaxID=2650924 RepID=UPI0018C61954|nr:DUF4864 domain-containing protein [Aestuariivirga litoralis]
MKYAALIFFSLFTFGMAHAEDGPSEIFKPIITHQMQAIAAGDANAAYSDASPMLQQIFPNAEIFMSMVRGGYPMVYRNKRYVFADSGVDPSGRPYQLVKIQDENGVFYDALYFMQQQKDGSWKISGCVIVKAKGEA